MRSSGRGGGGGGGGEIVDCSACDTRKRHADFSRRQLPQYACSKPSCLDLRCRDFTKSYFGLGYVPLDHAAHGFVLNLTEFEMNSYRSKWHSFYTEHLEESVRSVFEYVERIIVGTLCGVGRHAHLGRASRLLCSLDICGMGSLGVELKYSELPFFSEFP